MCVFCVCCVLCVSVCAGTFGASCSSLPVPWEPRVHPGCFLAAPFLLVLLLCISFRSVMKVRQLHRGTLCSWRGVPYKGALMSSSRSYTAGLLHTHQRAPLAARSSLPWDDDMRFSSRCHFRAFVTDAQGSSSVSEVFRAAKGMCSFCSSSGTDTSAPRSFEIIIIVLIFISSRSYATG